MRNELLREREGIVRRKGPDYGFIVCQGEAYDVYFNRFRISNYDEIQENCVVACQVMDVEGRPQAVNVTPINSSLQQAIESRLQKERSEQTIFPPATPTHEPISASTQLYKISLGKAQAEGETETLYKYFFPTKSYLIAKGEAHHRKLFYIGHRGAGKSALFNQLIYENTHQSNKLVIQITPKELTYETFKKMEHDFIDVKSAYATAWRYTLLVRVFIGISEHFQKHSNIRKNRQNVEVIDKYLSDHGYLHERFGVGVLIEFLRKLNMSKIDLTVKKFELGKPDKNTSRALDEADILRVFNALKNILDSTSIMLFVDELDTGWDNSEESKNFISGLFAAVYELNSLGNLSAFVSLRQDMYENLLSFLPNTEKMRDDMEFLHWDERGLKSLLARRILSNLPARFSDVNTEDALAMVFDQGVVDYIINHTLQRPREVIQFCNECLGEYLVRHGKTFTWLHAPGTDFSRDRIDEDIARSVQYKFSSYRFEDFCKEYEFELPELGFVLKKLEARKEFYDKDEFLGLLEGSMLEYLGKFGESNWIGLMDLNPQALLEVLFRIGFIRIHIPTYNQYVAYYQRSIMNFDTVEKIKISDMFCPALKLDSEH